MKKLWADFEDEDQINGWIKRCGLCRVRFVSRKDARFCSDACRQAAKRERQKALV